MFFLQYGLLYIRWVIEVVVYLEILQTKDSCGEVYGLHTVISIYTRLCICALNLCSKLSRKLTGSNQFMKMTEQRATTIIAISFS